MLLLPRILHQVWVGPRMPVRFRRYAAGLQKLHPDWEYRLWTERELAAVPMRNRELFDDADRYQSKRRVPRMQSNIARLEILGEFGGVYLDSDVIGLRALEPLLVDVEAFAAWSPNGSQHLTNAILGAVSGHPFIQASIDQLPRSVEDRPGQGSWDQTGPRHLSRVYESHGERVTVFPSSVFYPVGIQDLRGRRKLAQRIAEQTDAYTVHEWASQRGTRARKTAMSVARRVGLR